MRILNFLLFLAVAGWAIILIHTPDFFIPDTASKEIIVTAFRISVGLLLLVKLLRTLPGLPLIFGMGNERSVYVVTLCALWVLASLLLIIGLFTFFAALVLVITHSLFYLKSYYYSIGENYFQNTVFHLPFLGLGGYYSVDAYIGFDFIPETSFAWASYFVLNGIIMFSAGYQKIKSPMWRQGKGAISFLNLPHLVKKPFVPFIDKMESLIKPTGYLIMLCELILIFSIIYPISFIAVTSVLIVFAVSLFVIVDLSFIGQITALNLVLLGSLFAIHPVELDMNNLESFSHISVFFTVIVISSSISIFFPVFTKKTGLSSVLRVINGIAVPMNVFTERHQYGIFTCRFDSISQSKQVLAVFDDKGRFGRWQYWRPRQFQTMMYPITDYCLIRQHFGKEGRDNPKFKQLVDICYTAFKIGGVEHDSIQISVKSIEEDTTRESYIHKSWTPIFSVSFENGTIINTNICERPPNITKSLREISPA
ncbi:hypothetical protein [Rhodohalobacter sulfatireducens]|uniref:Uncharacterized protein n=1 Tax=Rhodohalobacter sulfatireducens TaxID=2911366 RepID=A0ABS9KIH2_9BACT|nr:hypothetical protein [Rhodohalobacter sulfatireducens]MCG2590660.1 hypothetical protein [Rhodohalobacter sulfatireducens]